jgi:KaiC/GvpD/RAD55 family RecA-like ATPase
MSLEKKLLTGCLQDESVLLKAKRAKLEPKHLEEGVYRYLYAAMLEISKVDTPAPEVVKQYIQLDDKKDSDDKKALNELVDSLSSSSTVGAGFSLEKLKDVRAEQEAFRLLSDMSNSLLQGEDLDQVLPELQRRSREINAQESDYELFDYSEDWSTRQMERQELGTTSAITMSMALNMSPFKKYFPRGIQPEELTAVAGPTYAGKSVLLTNLIRVAAHPENGMNVLYVFAENRKVQAASRLDAIVLDREYDTLYENNLKDPEGDSFFKTAQKEGWGKIILGKVTPRQFTADTIRQMIEEIKEDRGIDIDVVAIDSPDHQVPVDAGDQWWQNKGLVYWDNKALAEELELIMLCTLPMKASSVGNGSVKSEDVGGSYDIARICDNLIMFNVDPEDRLLNRGKIQVTKTRDNSTDNKIIYFYFEKNHRLLPWHEVFNGSVDPTGEADEDKVYRINQFKQKFTKEKKKEKEYETVAGFNVKKRKKKDEQGDDG